MPAAIIPAAMSLIEMGVGAANKSAAKAEAKHLRDTRPLYEISPESTNELNLAESELQGGMGSRAARAYTQQADKNISSSLSAILKGGGNVNNIGDLYGAADEGNLRLTQLLDNLRLNQIQNTVNARRNMRDERDKQFMYNTDQWWKADAQNNANNRQNADQQFWSGINGVANVGMQYWQNQSEQNQMNNYLNPPQPEYSNNNSTGYNPTLIQANNMIPQYGAGNDPRIKPIQNDPRDSFDFGLSPNNNVYHLTY